MSYDDDLDNDDLSEEALRAASGRKRKGRRSSSESQRGGALARDVEESVASLPSEIVEGSIRPIPTPVAYDPACAPAGTFIDEPWDRFLPGPGFLRDFTYAMKGTETNTGFSMWSAVWAISTILCRDAWIKWYPGKLLPNFYIFIIALPGMKKSTSATFALSVVRKVPDVFERHGNPVLAFKKFVPITEERATTESLNILLKAESKAFFVQRGESKRILNITKPSQFSICADELTTFLDQSSYNKTLIDRLTKLYDGNDESSAVTLGRGIEKFKDIYVNFVGATTPDGLRMSLPETAFGGGFMSRVVTVYSDIQYRIFDEPQYIEGTPTPADLVERLAWIAENCSGEYVFSEEARAFIKSWYVKFKTTLFDGHLHDNKMTDFRKDINLRKLSMIMRCQRYETGNVIELSDVKAALAMLEYTFTFSGYATEDIGPEANRNLGYIRRKLQREGRIKRAKLTRYASGNKIGVNDLDTILWQLHQEALLRIESGSGVEIARPGMGGGDETYVWIGSADDKEDSNGAE